jgi:hypothetical protein
MQNAHFKHKEKKQLRVSINDDSSHQAYYKNIKGKLL